MDIKIRCPNCRTKLIVEDDLVGQSVLCEECDKPFTVEAPRPTVASERGEPRKSRDADDTDFEYEFDDDRPIRRKPRAKPNALAPMIFGGSLVLAIVLVAVGLFFAFGFDFPGSSTSVPAGGKFRLSNPRWIPNRGFSVDIETVDGQPAAGRYRLAWRSTDERSSGNSTLGNRGSRYTEMISIPRPLNQSFQIWVENDPPVAGTKLSNIAILQ